MDESPYTPEHILDALLAAGLGDIPQPLITPDQFARALAGETVHPTSHQKRQALTESGMSLRQDGGLPSRTIRYGKRRE